jgi:D-alanine-D-alanine ligase
MWGSRRPPFQVFHRGEDPQDQQLDFPFFVKPVREGTGMGINGQSVVYNEKQLREQVRWVIQTYRQPALVEGYLPGREFTVGLIGNTLSPGEGRWNDPSTALRRGSGQDSGHRLYDDRGFHLFPVLEIDANVGAGQGLYNAASKSFNLGEEGAPLYLCPAAISATLEAERKQLAVAAFEAIGALDLSRVDFRLGSDGQPYLLEINTLPGLNPVVSDLCIMARTEGMHYTDLINEILYLAADRYAQESGEKGRAYIFQDLALLNRTTIPLREMA